MENWLLLTRINQNWVLFLRIDLLKNKTNVLSPAAEEFPFPDV